VAVFLVLVALVFGLALVLPWGRPFRPRWRPWGPRMVPPPAKRTPMVRPRRRWRYRPLYGRRWRW
jgi:hypothetical protein